MENRDIFLTYPELFHDQVLEKLLALKQRMLSIRPLDETQTRGAFTFFMFTDNTSLPTFDDAFFPSDQLPNFQDPGVVLRSPVDTKLNF